MDPNVMGGYIGAIIGVVGGLGGGIFGSYCSIRNTKGPRERAFMVRATFGAWLYVLAFLAALFLASGSLRWLLFIPYTIVLIAAILYCNRTQLRIRQDEQSVAPSSN